MELYSWVLVDIEKYYYYNCCNNKVPGKIRKSKLTWIKIHHKNSIFLSSNYLKLYIIEKKINSQNPTVMEIGLVT